MLEFLKKASKERKFDINVLRKNNISLLILDERWNHLFISVEKSDEIIKREIKLKELLKEQSRITTESKNITARKKECVSKILALTTEVFDNNNEEAKKEMHECEKEVKRINERLEIIEKELEEMPESIKQMNLELLEKTVNLVYFQMRSNQRRVKELELLIEETHQKLRDYIDEKGTLEQDDTDIYSYFHDLLGAEELEKLDKEFFGGSQL
jgi:hypothetical protein